ncbi:MAG: hypothetical protein L6461_00490, partial [Anaerolineae bacterium]|nr:hypothetical protein [Anaerolineae bacterium]
ASLYVRAIKTPWVQWTDGIYRRSITLWIGSFDPFLLQNVEKVIYHLPSSFPNPVQKVESSSTFFSLLVYSAFDFAVVVEIYFKEQTEPLIINGYITLFEMASYISPPPLPPSN